MTSFNRRRQNEDLLNKKRALRFLQGFKRSYHYREIRITKLLGMLEGNETASKLISVLRKELRTAERRLAELDAQCQEAERSLDQPAQGIHARHDQVGWAGSSMEHIAAQSRPAVREGEGDLDLDIFEPRGVDVEGHQEGSQHPGDVIAALRLGTVFAAALTWYSLVLELLSLQLGAN